LSVKVENGAIYPGQKLALLPCGEEITINSIYDDDDKCRPCATIGESVKLYIKGDLSILKGHMLSSLYNLPYICSEIEVDIYIIDLHQHKPIFTKGYECIMHMNSLTENVFIKEIKSVYNATKKLFEPVKFLKKGARGISVIVIKNNEPFVCDKYQQNLKTGSFVLRDEDRTIAFCKILRVKPIFT